MSAPIPENAERRAAIATEVTARTGLDEPTLERLVRAFYGTAREDPLLAPIFAHVADWEEHIARIRDFWSSVVLQSGRYRGNPLAAHVPFPLGPEHFARWLALFEHTANIECTPEGAALIVDRARRIAQSLQLGVAVQRGELPPLRVRAAAAAPAAGG